MYSDRLRELESGIKGTQNEVTKSSDTATSQGSLVGALDQDDEAPRD